MCHFVCAKPKCFQGVSYFEAKGSHGLKLSPSPSPQGAAVFTSLKDLREAIVEVGKHGKVADVLEHGLALLDLQSKFSVDELLEKFEATCDQEVQTVKQKVSAQFDLMSREVSEMKLPVYDTSTEGSETSRANQDKIFLQSEAAGPATKAVNKIKNFLAAVQKCCCELAGLEIDKSAAESAMQSARTFVYVFTAVSILHSTTWKSLCPRRQLQRRTVGQRRLSMTRCIL